MAISQKEVWKIEAEREIERKEEKEKDGRIEEKRVEIFMLLFRASCQSCLFFAFGRSRHRDNEADSSSRLKYFRMNLLCAV